MEIYKNKLLIFIITTFLFSWLIWLPLLINSSLEPVYLITIGTCVPSVIGILIYLNSYKIGFKQYIKQSFRFRLKLRNYVLMFLLPIGIVGTSYGLMHVFGFEVPNLSYMWYELPIVFLTILVLMGPLGEEFGWRGYLYNVLREKYSIFSTSLIIGIVWTFWHLPKFFIEDVLQNDFTKLYGIGLSLLGYLFYTICLSFLISVYFEKTKRSIVTPLVMHTMANLSIGLIPLVFNQTGALIQLSIMFLFAVFIYIKNQTWINKKPL